jgi:hypothetical protein
VCTYLKSVLSIKCRSNLDNAILENFLHFAIAAESVSPTAFSLYTKIVNDILASRARESKEFDYACALNDALACGTTKPTGEDIKQLAMKFLDGDVQNLRELFLTTIDLAGADGTVMIERAVSNETVELVVGYVFNLEPAINVAVKLINPRIIMIDGFVETVSEIHRLLEDAAVTKEPVVMFIRGMSDDVKHTLAVNYTRNSLHVVPVIVPFDIEGLNMLKDIAIVSGSDIVSSNKGDLISNIKLDCASRVEKVTIYKDKIIIMNDCTRSNVSAHVNELKKLRDNNNVDHIEALYDKRIKVLSPRHVIVRLRDNIEFIRRSQALDYTFRGVRSLRDHGMVVFDTPVSQGRELVMTAFSAVKHAMSFVNMSSQLSAAIIATLNH